ncbi:MAG: hypothetical protein ACK53L_12270, partial [Pirellulaceae bacterium]
SLARASISCSSTHTKPLSGPLQQLPHWVHSKASPDAYQGSLGLELSDITTCRPEVTERG